MFHPKCDAVHNDSFCISIFWLFFGRGGIIYLPSGLRTICSSLPIICSGNCAADRRAWVSCRTNETAFVMWRPWLLPVEPDEADGFPQFFFDDG
jgi:hypothetical protein